MRSVQGTDDDHEVLTIGHRLVAAERRTVPSETLRT